MKIVILKNIVSSMININYNKSLIALILIIFSILLFRQCEQTKKAEWEAVRISNNLKASQDTIRNYIDKNGNSAAEILALTLTLDEAKESLEFEKNKPPVIRLTLDLKIFNFRIENQWDLVYKSALVLRVPAYYHMLG
jgi:hypothetical protein